MNGLSITVPTTFSRVLTDLSFIPDVVPEKLAYTGLFGGSEASSLVNSATSDVKSVVTGITTRAPERLSYYNGYFHFVSPNADSAISTGIRAGVPLASIDKNGYPATLVMSFRNAKKTKEIYRRLYPLASFFMSISSLTAAPVLFVALFIGDSGERRIAAWSGSIGDATSDSDAAKCSLPIDWQATTDLITVGVSRSASGLVTLSAKVGGGAVQSTSYQFPIAADSGNPSDTEGRFLYGSMDTRTVESADIMTGQYWLNTALTMSELQKQVALIHLKANARL